MNLFLVLVLSLVASGSFASEQSAVDKLTTYLPIGNYAGINDNGSSCFVEVNEVNYPKKEIQVRVVDGINNLTKLITENSEFSYKDYKREFIQVEQNSIGTDDTYYIERTIRTMSADKDKLYVVVSYSTVLNRDTETQTAECIIYR